MASATTTVTESPIMTYVTMALTLLASIATGGLKADVGVAQDVAALIAECLPMLAGPTLAGLAGILGATVTLLNGVNQGALAGDAQVGIMLVGMVQAAAAAVQQQSGAPIDPTKVPQLPPFSAPTPAA